MKRNTESWPGTVFGESIVLMRRSSGFNPQSKCIQESTNQHQLVWLSGLSTGLQTKGFLVRFPVRAHAWVVAGSPVGGVQEATTH